MNVHSLPSALRGLGVSLGAGSPCREILLGLRAWTRGLGLVLEHNSALVS